MGFPGDSDSKEAACNLVDPALIPGSGGSPGERNATHSSVLAWRIPQTEEPGGLQSMVLQRVGHNRETKQQYATPLSSSVVSEEPVVNCTVSLSHFSLATF